MIPCRACGGSPGAPRVGWRYDEECRACGAYGIDPGGPVADAPVPTPPTPRRPVAGWVDRHHGYAELPSSEKERPFAWIVECYDNQWRWSALSLMARNHVAHGLSESKDAAQLAAEDALRAVLVDAAAALGMRVVP